MSIPQHLDRATRRVQSSGAAQQSTERVRTASSGRGRQPVVAALLGLALLALVAVGVVLYTRSSAPATHGSQAARVDPDLILTPKTVTQSKQIGGLRLALTASPLIPGLNHFTLRLDSSGHAVRQASIGVTAIMLGMYMRPLHITFTRGAGDRYTAAGSLPMFGDWRLALQVRPARGATVTTVFPLSLDLPAGLYAASHSK